MKTTTKLGQNNSKPYSQILNLLEKESKEKKRTYYSCGKIYSSNLITKRHYLYIDICIYINLLYIKKIKNHLTRCKTKSV